VRPFPIEELVDRVGSRFTVVVAAAKRAKQIKDGAPPLINLPTRNALTIALHEIAAGLIQIGDAPPEPDLSAEAAAEEIGDLAAPEVVEALLGRPGGLDEEDIADEGEEDDDTDLDEELGDEGDEEDEDAEEDEDEDLEEEEEDLEEAEESEDE